MFRSILLQFQLFFDVIQVILIHVREEILGGLLLVPDELGGIGLDLVSRLVSNLCIEIEVLA